LSVLPFALALGLVLAATEERPTGPSELEIRALALFKQGEARFHAGDYDGAIEAFRAADALAPSPEYAFNIAQAYRKKGDCVHALGSYREFVRLKPAVVEQKMVREQLAELETCARETAPAPLPVAPLPSEAKPVERVERRDGPSSHGAAWGVLGAGAVIGGLGAGLWSAAAGSYNHLANTCGTACNPQLVSGPRSELYVGYVAVAAGAAVLATGALLFFRGGPTVVVAPTPGGATVALSWER
jgi:tetratricopeptide (TPR) repeat protein